MNFLKWFCLSVTAVLAVLSLAGPVLATAKRPHLQTNQSYIEQLLQSKRLNIDDVASVLSFVLTSLPDEVQVYPTENYYYFSFYQSGMKYRGNLRLDAADRDRGKIHFAYFPANADWSNDLKTTVKIFDGKNGVEVSRIDRFNYRVSFRGRRVVFRLNDLSNVQPASGTLFGNEIYLGPIFDESAIEFFLIYNKSIKKFHYILNRLNKVPDNLLPIKNHNRILVGQRTGFVFYQDHLKDRLILIGVNERSAALNTFFDGPFDQLPDNFIRGDELKQAFIDQNPRVANKIDRFGNAADGNNRISISPYLYYVSLDELYGFDDCAQKYKTSPDKYYVCFDAETLNLE